MSYINFCVARKTCASHNFLVVHRITVDCEIKFTSRTYVTTHAQNHSGITITGQYDAFLSQAPLPSRKSCLIASQQCKTLGGNEPLVAKPALYSCNLNDLQNLTEIKKICNFKQTIATIAKAATTPVRQIVRLFFCTFRHFAFRQRSIF